MLCSAQTKAVCNSGPILFGLTVVDKTTFVLVPHNCVKSILMFVPFSLPFLAD